MSRFTFSQRIPTSSLESSLCAHRCLYREIRETKSVVPFDPLRLCEISTSFHFCVFSRNSGVFPRRGFRVRSFHPAALLILSLALSRKIPPGNFPSSDFPFAATRRISSRFFVPFLPWNTPSFPSPLFSFYSRANSTKLAIFWNCKIHRTLLQTFFDTSSIVYYYRQPRRRHRRKLRQ